MLSTAKQSVDEPKEMLSNAKQSADERAAVLFGWPRKETCIAVRWTNWLLLRNRVVCARAHDDVCERAGRNRKSPREGGTGTIPSTTDLASSSNAPRGQQTK